MNLEWLDACAMAQAIQRGELSSGEVVEAALARAQTVGTQLNCYTEIFGTKARAEAARIDAARKAGKPLGPLAGVPFAVKNLFDVAGVVTLAGSIINRDQPPATEDAAAVRRLREAGAILVGALGMDEYAYGFTSENSHYGAVRNPHDLSRTAGGSSGGSSAAVAGGCVPLALGTDTNGSVRVPASLCGLFGLKPTYGRVSRAGTALFAPSLDHVGWLTRSVRDAALCFDLLHGHDARDPVSSERAREATLPALAQGVRGLRIGIAAGYFEEEATPPARDATQRVATALDATSRHELPGATAARHAAMIVTAAEGSALHRENLRKRPSDFDRMTRDRFLAGALLPGDAYVRAQTFRRAFQAAVRRVFEQVDVLIAPATPMVAPEIGQETIEVDGRALASRAHLGRFTQPLSFIGLPVMVVPLSAPGTLPIGVQLIGAPYSEGSLLRAARFLETQGVAAARRPSL
jgi:AtzE family amidohydrolase